MVLFLTLLAGEKTKIGGFELKTLKKLKGDKFGFPFHQQYLQKQLVWEQLNFVNILEEQQEKPVLDRSKS